MNTGRGKWNLKSPDELAFLAAAGKRFRDARLAKDLTKRELAKKIGCPDSIINRFEHGKGVIQLHKLAKACIVLDVSVDKVLGLSEEVRKIAQEVTHEGN